MQKHGKMVYQSLLKESPERDSSKQNMCSDYVEHMFCLLVSLSPFTVSYSAYFTF